MSPTVHFRDRTEAGRRLAEKLVALDLDRPIVYALPRGGVPVAVEIARRLGAPLDIVLVRKIGAPGAPELALGAVVDGDEPMTVVNTDIAEATGASSAYLERVRDEELAEIERRRGLYLGRRARPDPRGRTVIVVDDGLATGATARAAAEALRRHGAGKILIAAPVAPAETIEALQDVAEVICVETPRPFGGVGRFYVDFHQLSDAEVVQLLQAETASS
jgi:predicted phosphoribosyltransferase